MKMLGDRGATTPFWVDIGQGAQGLVVEGSIIAVIYLAPREADDDGAATPPYFYSVLCSNPQIHDFILEDDGAGEVTWAAARKEAARLYFGPLTSVWKQR